MSEVLVSDMVVSGTPLAPRSRDALSVLAYMYLMFDRPAEAAVLLRALAAAGGDDGWAASTRCLALVMAGQHEAARAEAARLLPGAADDTVRALLLRVLARAAWNLGLGEEARAHQAALRALLAATVMRRDGDAGR
jgi:hypothetical protein